MKTQSPLFRQKFNYYKQYARADISKIFTKKEIKGAENWIVNYDKSSYVENLGNGKSIVRMSIMIFIKLSFLNFLNF